MSYTAFDLCEWLRTEVLTEVTRAGFGDEVTTSYSTAGDVSWDDVGEGCGTLIVTVERVYRSVTFPDEAIGRELCDAGTICAVLHVHLVRCVPVLQESGLPPDPATLQGVHEARLREAALVWKAVSELPLYDAEWERAGVSQAFAQNGGAFDTVTSVIIGVESELWCT